jgi:hypothetical protein
MGQAHQRPPKSSAQGAADGAPYIARHLIEVTDRDFDGFAYGRVDRQRIDLMLRLTT